MNETRQEFKNMNKLAFIIIAALVAFPAFAGKRKAPKPVPPPPPPVSEALAYTDYGQIQIALGQIVYVPVRLTNISNVPVEVYEISIAAASTGIAVGAMSWPVSGTPCWYVTLQPGESCALRGSLWASDSGVNDRFAVKFTTYYDGASALTLTQVLVR